jgi:hypothetical protein
MTRSRTGFPTPAAAVIAGCAVALFVASPLVPRAQAYPMYDDGSGVGCIQCHFGADGFEHGNGPLHLNHRTTFGITNAGCNLCHLNGGGSTPVYTYKSGEGFGCAGCHGRDYGETSITSGQPKATAYGLRQFHVNQGVTSCGLAGGCHVPGHLGFPNPFPPILGENVPPPYYGNPLDNLTDPCSSAQEDMPFDADTVGLDNDGDGLVDWPADPDCPQPTTTTTTLPPNSGDVGITGKKLIIVDKTTTAGKAKVVYVAKDTPADKGTTDDAGQISATFDYESPTLGTSGSATMPSGAGWLVNKATVAKYVNKEAPGGASAVKVAVIKPTKLLKVIVKDLGDAGSKIDIYAAGNPSPSTVDMTTQLTVTDGLTVRRHCSEFTGCSRKLIAAGTGAKVVCKTATAGGSVACPGSPSGAFLE